MEARKNASFGKTGFAKTLRFTILYEARSSQKHVKMQSNTKRGLHKSRVLRGF